MRRLFYGNFDFEHRLADPHREPTKILKRLNAELATAWLALAQEGDLVWTPSPIDLDFFSTSAAAGLPRVVPIETWNQIPRDIEFVPWGWSHEMRSMSKKFAARIEIPAHEAILRANSRETSHALEQLWEVGLEGARQIKSLHELDALFSTPLMQDQPWVIKAEYGMSGRERIRGCGLLTGADRQWVQRRIGPDRSLFYEPWVERIAETGIQIDVPQQGPVRLVGLTPMFVDDRGQYAGSRFQRDQSHSAGGLSVWDHAIEVTLRAAASLQALGYFGPLGIDSMQYRDQNGSIRVRPLQDINARWTMGRLSLGFARMLNTSEVGLWIHGSTRTLDACSSRINSLNITRTIPTSPHMVGGEPCSHVSQLIIGEDESHSVV